MPTIDLKIPPLALTAIALATIIGANALAPRDTPFTWLPIIGVLLAAIGFAILLGAAIQFRRSHTTLNPINPESATTFVASGLYRYTRNPMYLGMALVVAAAAVWFASFVGVIVLAGFCAYLTRFQIRPEERAMLRRFGTPYENYMKQVRRWL
jgi:protein-S-isoprenylcysteine O-methyltransferase Ste14